jgi:hypothetical protein
MRLVSLFRVFAGAAGVLTSIVAAAQTPVGAGFFYQGMLKDAAGPANGTYDLQFRLFDAATGGATVGSWICIDNKPVTGGLVTADLDFGSVFDGSALWLEIRVRGDATPANCFVGGGPYTTLTPRQRITSTPNALFAQAPWGSSGNDVFWGGNVGIGTATPSNRLTVANEEDGNSIVAIDSGDTAAQSSILHLNDRGTAIWSVLKNAANKFAIREVGPAEDRLVVVDGGNVGIGTSTPSNRLTVANENDNSAIIAIDTGDTAPQLSALRLNDRGNAIWGVNKPASNDFAIREIGPGADRLYIEQGGNIAIGTNAPGAHLHVTGASGSLITAIKGYSPGVGHGVAGETDSTSNFAGVYGIGQAPAAFGVYSLGRFAATGTKLFQIDHPLDPAGHYLNHYCTEGPEPLNVYSGNVVLGAAGTAVVHLPAYFSSINRDVRYQLTCVGGYAPVHVSQEVTGNQFVIGGGHAGLKVSWRVEATRNDAWVRAYGAPVEEAKPAERQGTYLHPELFGRPPEQGEHARFRK